jgi:hypothetical protein
MHFVIRRQTIFRRYMIAKPATFTRCGRNASRAAWHCVIASACYRECLPVFATSNVALERLRPGCLRVEVANVDRRIVPQSLVWSSFQNKHRNY